MRSYWTVTEKFPRVKLWFGKETENVRDIKKRASFVAKEQQTRVENLCSVRTFSYKFKTKDFSKRILEECRI